MEDVMTKYMGHRSWNAWNVSLWINNDENLYRWAAELARKHGTRKAAAIMARDLEGQRTPDGGRYNATCIREAISDILS
jgi:hypothetical protein